TSSIGLLGHTEHATPVGAPISTPADPWTIGPPYFVISPIRAAGFPLIPYSLMSFFFFIPSYHCLVDRSPIRTSSYPASSAPASHPSAHPARFLLRRSSS
ncbi:hypothetical protein EZ749_13120, partial [Salmonella enterica subsp. enterica serovar Chailey]|nr:hypothetical protein [Salmonella enterica subsp. enterica serovar Chailey]